MPKPPQLDAAFQQVTAVLTQVEGKPVDLVKDSWNDIEKVVIKVLGGPFNPNQQEHQVVALGLAAALGERLHADHQAFWFPYRETPEGASLGFPEALIMLAPFGAVVDALMGGRLERVDEVVKTIRNSLAQARFSGGAQQMRLGPEDYMRLFDPGFVQLVAADPAKLKQAWDATPEKTASELRDGISRAQRLPPEAKKQLEQQLVGAVQRLDAGKPVITSAAKAPRVVETVGLLFGATTGTGPAAEEFWGEMVMPLLFTGAPATFPPLDDEELAAAKTGVDPLFLFLDIVPHQFKSPEEGLLGVFPVESLSPPAPEFRSTQAPRLIKVNPDSLKEALAAFDADKTRDAIKRFGEYLKEKGGVATGEAQGGQEAKLMLDAAMTLLTDLKAAVAPGLELFVRRMTEAEASSEAALSLVRQSLQSPRIILAP